MSLIKNATPGIRWGGLSQLIYNLVGIIRLPIIAIYLGPAEFGLLSIIFMINGLAELFSDMGIGKAIIQVKDFTHREFSTLYWFNIFIAIVIYLIVISVTPIISYIFHNNEITAIIPISSLSLIIASFGQQYGFLLYRELCFREQAIINIIVTILGFIFTIILLLFGFGIWSVVIGGLLSSGFRSCLLIIIGIKYYVFKNYFEFKLIKRFINFGLFQLGQKIINYAYSNFDYLFIGVYLNVTSLGYYYMAYNIVIKPIKAINPLINSVSFPIFSKLQENLLQIKRGFLKINYLLSLILIPFFISVVFLSPKLVFLILGEKWVPSIILLQILSILGFIRAMENIIGSVTLALGKANLGFYYSAISLILYVPTIILGAKWNGVVGVAVGISILQFILLIPYYRIMVIKSLGSVLREYLKSFIPSLKLCCALCLFLLTLTVFESNLLSVFYAVLQILVVLSVSFSWLFFIEKDFINIISQIILKNK